MTTWPVSGNEHRWNGYSHNSLESSGSRQRPVNPVSTQAPTGYFPAPLVGDSQGLAPIFAEDRETSTYILPPNHIPGSHARANEYRHSLSAGFPLAARFNPSFVERPRSFVRNTDGVSEDGRHHNMRPLRRPPHWEDDPYPANSFRRDTGIRDNLDAPPGFHTHCIQPEIYRRYTHSLCGLPSVCCSNEYQSSHAAVRVPNGCQSHCTYWNSCSPCEGSLRRSTLTYIGPPCAGNLPCSHCAPPHMQAIASCAPQQQHRSNAETVAPGGGDSSERHVDEGKRSWGVVRRWLAKRSSIAKKVNPKLQKGSDNTTQRSEIEHTQGRTERPGILTTGLRRISPGSAETAATTSRIRETSPTSETIVTSSSSHIQATSLNDHTRTEGKSSSLPRAAHSIPRPPSTASTCQCYPINTTLHRVLHHTPFDSFIIQWDITLSPREWLIWGSKPEDILSNQRNLDLPDLPRFYDEHATNPPIRHMFINSLGNFPLERCQGDPDPSRSRNRERHMYNSRNGDERVEMRTLPWPIRVNGTSGTNGYVTLWDVFRAIYNNFQEYIPKEEYESYTIQKKRSIASAYHQRQMILDEKRSFRPNFMSGVVFPEISENWIEDGFMRCDYLGSSILFRGFEISPDKEGYTLFLGPY